MLECISKIILTKIVYIVLRFAFVRLSKHKLCYNNFRLVSPLSSQTAAFF